MIPAYQRFAILDWLRAFAVLLMIIYHFLYDLQAFRLISSAAFNHITITIIGRSCLCLFMFCVGYSLAIAHGDKIHWQKFFRRWTKVALAAGLVSLVTFSATRPTGSISAYSTALQFPAYLHWHS